MYQITNDILFQRLREVVALYPFNTDTLNQSKLLLCFNTFGYHTLAHLVKHLRQYGEHGGIRHCRLNHDFIKFDDNRYQEGIPQRPQESSNGGLDKDFQEMGSGRKFHKPTRLIRNGQPETHTHIVPVADFDAYVLPNRERAQMHSFAFCKAGVYSCIRR